MTGDAITFVAPEEETDLRAIERAINKRLPRVTVPDFDYKQRPPEKLEIPIQERIAAIRARKAEDRVRAKAKAERRAAAPAPRSAAPARPQGGPARRPAAAPRPGTGVGPRPSGTAAPRGPAPSGDTRRPPSGRGRRSR
jgi:ATP-dependent RNA helicase RhlE